MSASLASGRIDVNQPKATANASARSSIEMKDSCNCCKFCIPCFGRKIKKEDPIIVRNNRTTEIMREAFAMPPTPRETSQGSLKRSPGMESLDITSYLHLTIDSQANLGDK